MHPRTSCRPALPRLSLPCILVLLAAPALGLRAQPTVYWSNTYAGSIQRTVVGTGVVEELIEGFVDRPHSLRLDLDEGKLYWALAVESPSPLNAAIQRSDLDGFFLENVVLSGFCNPYCPMTAMALDADHDSLYWFTWDGSFPTTHTLYRSDLQGANVLPIGAYDNVVLDIQLDPGSGHLYWIDGKWPVVLADHAIMRSRVGGSEPEQILLVFDGKPPEEGNLAVDSSGGKLYWVTQTRAIRRANLDGTGVEDLVGIEGDPDSTRLSDLALDAANGKMYWSVTYGGVNTFPAGVIHRANLDGSDIEEMVRVEPGGIGAFAIDFSGLVSRENPVETATSLSLGPAYPNPATQSVTIPLTLTGPGPATIEVWDLLGRRARVFPLGIQGPGRQDVEIDLDGLPSGVYLYRLRAVESSPGRMLIVR